MYTRTSKQEEDEEEVLFPPIVMDTSYTNVIIVEGLPVIPPEKLEKLSNMVKKVFSTVGNSQLTIADFYMPFHDVNGKSESKG
jgi:hypothetical protein